ncbi:hypothetical protein [Aporhodopirellula aestuarii]|uniref:Uncharacterized protein n=1 Tax=Aporhodopirellula aestuarii TaxID=2950107 RepID=A0ABT0UBX4_9BACT|nr:hypothetical protein [Aporhodopirellula aestuarii]MCM2373868.1 hypothetical protein [Aporhodopirellula aestuarii]
MNYEGNTTFKAYWNESVLAVASDVPSVSLLSPKRLTDLDAVCLKLQCDREAKKAVAADGPRINRQTN